MKADVAEYEADFWRHPMLPALWGYTVRGPDGLDIGDPIGGFCTSKAAAERAALRVMEVDASGEKNVLGADLIERVKS